MNNLEELYSYYLSITSNPIAAALLVMVHKEQPSNTTIDYDPGEDD